MEIDNDSMVSLMQEALSDDLWDRYMDDDEMERFEDESPESTKQLMSLWKREIGEFKIKCQKLGHKDREINKVIEETITDGLKYLESDRKIFDLVK